MAKTAEQELRTVLKVEGKITRANILDGENAIEIFVVPKDLYYRIFEKEDEYTQEETKAMLKRVGYNLTYFSHFIKGRQIGNCEVISYRYGKDRMNTPEKYEEGMRLIEAFEERQRIYYSKK